MYWFLLLETNKICIFFFQIRICTVYVIHLQVKTRIVRGSDYSPASELFARLRKTMTGNNPKLVLVNFDAR